MRSLHTPQQETNAAYNPGVTYRGGEFLAQGIGQAAGALTEGFHRYQANKEENAALDTRFEGTAKPLMEKLKLLGQLADENSPAVGLLDKAADWHKLGTSQKKVLLADMLLLGDKAEAEQRRKEDDQWKLLAAQDRQAQFEEQQRQHAAQRGQWAADTLFRGIGAYQDNRRLGLSERGTALSETIHADLLKRQAREAADAEAQRLAQGTFLRDFNQFAEGPQFNGTGMQRPMSQFEAYRRAAGANPRAFTTQQMDDIGRMAVSEDRFSQGAREAFNPSLSVQTATLSDGTVVEIPVGRVGPNGAQFFPEFSPTGNRKYPGTAATGGAKVARPTTEIERHRMIADNEKAIAALRTRAADPKIQGAEYMDAMRQIKRKQAEIDGWIEEPGTRETQSPASSPAAATPQAKAARANALAAENPGWSRQQVIEAVNREFSR